MSSTTRDRLKANDSLDKDGVLTSSNGRFIFCNQGDGNIVLYDKQMNNRVLWKSDTYGRSAGKITMQSDGNLVGPAWSSKTGGKGNATCMFIMQDDGNAVIRSDDTQIWQTNTKQRSLDDEKKPLTAGGSLQADQALTSPSSRYRFVMQGDCNLVLYATQDGNRVLWASNTSSRNANARLQLGTDGNLVVFDGGSTKWSSSTGGKGNGSTTLTVQDDGNVVLVSNGIQIWQTDTKQRAPSPRLNAGETLRSGENLVSASNRFKITMQGDGNLVAYDEREKREIWASKTGHWTIKNPKASLQTDGNLVVYDGNGSSKWASNTRCANAVLTMQDDGNVVMTADGKQIWATGSQQRMTEKPKRTDSIFAGDSLQAGQKINSANGKYYLEVTTDCVKVCKQDGSELWSAGRTAGNSAANLTFRSDGELQLLTRHDYVRWGSGTAGKGNVESCCIIQDDGNFVLITDGKMIWHTNTRREADGSIRKTDRLPSGETIGKEGRLTSPNGKCEFVFQGDGNFVLYADGKPTWSSKTNWEAKGVVLRDDDNLVITGTNWHSGTRRRLNGGTAELILSDDGKAILKSENIVIWSTDPTLVRPSPPKVTAVQSGVAKLNPGEYLAVNQSLTSPNDQFMATLQPDGNFVLFYKPVYLPLWRTNTAPNSAVTKLVMQYDSNLALLGAADAPVWTSKTDSRDGNASLYLQNDGNLVVSGGEKNWSSNIQLPALRGQVNQLNPGDSLLYFQSLTSKNGQYNLKFDNNGKISITKDGQSTYYTTAGNLSDAKFLTFNASYEEYRTTSPKLTLRNGSGQDIWTAAARESDVGRVERAREARNNKERREAEDQGRTHRDYYRRPTYDPPRFTLQDDGDAIIWFENDTVWSLKSLAKA